MQFDEALQAVLDARYSGTEPPAEAVRLLQSTEGKALLERSNQLDLLLAFDEAHEPGPGFDTRFFARLEEHKGHRKKRGVFAWIAVAGAGAAAGFLLLSGIGVLGEAEITPGPEDAEIAMMRDLELLEELEVLEKLEEVETFEILAALDEDTLEQMLGESSP